MQLISICRGIKAAQISELFESSDLDILLYFLISTCFEKEIENLFSLPRNMGFLIIIRSWFS